MAEDIRGVAYVDGDSSGGLTPVLYRAGETTARSLDSDEYLYITNIAISCETGGDVFFDFDEDDDDDHDAEDLIFAGALDAKALVELSFQIPISCPKGNVPKFYGAATNINSCIFTGYIRKA